MSSLNLNELTTFVFVRNDLGERQTEIQSNHACNRLGWRLGAEYGGNPPDSYLIAKAELNTKSLLKLAKKAADAGVPHYLMLDSDVDPLNATALAVFPLNAEQTKLFRSYPLRTYSPRVEKSVADFNVERGANAAVAQTL